MTNAITDTTGTIRLVLGIARLGENDLRGWWQGHALDRTGQYVLSSTFRRTWRAAALELDMAAATRIHDQVLGRPTALHLFSDLVPFRRWAKAWLAEQKTPTDSGELLATFETWTEDTAVCALRDWTGPVDAPGGEALGNGLLLGRLTGADLDDPGTSLQTARLLSTA